MAFFRDRVSVVLNSWISKTVVLIVFALYLGGACYGVTTLKEGLERRKLSRADSYSIEFYDREDYYFREFPYRIQVVVSGELNYSDPLVQQQMENLTQSFENTTFISSPLYTESWIRSFVGYVKRNQDYLNVSIDTEEDFIDTLKELWLFKPNPFSLDVKFNDDGTKIIASRFLIQAVNITDSNDEKAMVRVLRKICEESPLNASVFHPYFVFFDQFELVRPTTIQSMIIGAIIMMLVCFIFIPNAMCSLWVALSIVSIEIGVAGYMALWGVRLDSISMINLIMCIGFSVDFTAHICYAYMSSKASQPDEKLRECLYALGLPIVQGASSTILAVVSLLLAESYIFVVFFKMVFLVVFFGAMHGLFLLPVLLTLFGPGSCCPKDEVDDEQKQSSVEKTFPHPFCIPHPSLHPMTHTNGFMYRNGNGDLKISKNYIGNHNGKPFSNNDSKLCIKTNGPLQFGIPLPGLPNHLHNESGKVKYVDGNGSVVLEKDLGIGSSGEDSSESSSSKSQRRLQREAEEDQRRRYEEGWRKSSACPNLVTSNNRKSQEFQPSHFMEVYNNSGYISDEECKTRARAWYRNHNRPLRYQDDSQIPRRYSMHESHSHDRLKSKSQHSPHGHHHHHTNVTNYGSEMKFR